MSTVPAEVDGPSDAELIESVRAGTTSAYGPLYERHVAAARNLARQLTRSPAEADDLVSEAFAKVLGTLKQGRGPDSAFRAYLLTALRHTAYDKTRRDRKVELSDDVSQVSGVDPAAVSVPFADTAVAGLDRSLAARAFASLPERWQAVLWHTEIEGQSPAQVAPVLGLSANGVSALAYRAREGLKQAYLQVHLAETDAHRCRATAERLGAWVRGGLSKRETAQVEAHLDECDRCRALAAELAEVNSSLRAYVAPLVLGPLAVAGYLATAKAAAGTSATTAVSAVTAAGAAGSAASAGSGAGGAAAGAPRQFLAAAASGVALAAAIAIGVAATPAGQQIPAAAAPTAPAEAPPSVDDPAPQPPAPTAAPSPTAPPSQTPPSGSTSAPAAPAAPADDEGGAGAAPQPPQNPPPPSPTPTPGPPSLSADGPSAPVSLTPGEAANLPITIRNTGGSVSDPVVSTLTLPRGVRAVQSGPNRYGATPLLRLDAPAGPTGTVYCAGGNGNGAARCATEQGLRPGGSVTLVYRLVADATAASGTITGRVTAGGAVNVGISLSLLVAPPPKVDKVAVTASVAVDDLFGVFWVWGREYRVLARAENRGTSTKPVAVSFSGQARLAYSSTPVTCASGPARYTCTTTEPLAPGAAATVVVSTEREQDQPHGRGDRKVLVSATLGTATDSNTVLLPWAPWWPGLAPGAPGEPPPSKPTTTAPPTATPEPTAPPATSKTSEAVEPPVTTSARPAPAPPASPVSSSTPPAATTAPAPTVKPGPQPAPTCENGKHKPKWWHWDC